VVVLVVFNPLKEFQRLAFKIVYKLVVGSDKFERPVGGDECTFQTSLDSLSMACQLSLRLKVQTDFSHHINKIFDLCLVDCTMVFTFKNYKLF
jgi:hypothetical protein